MKRSVLLSFRITESIQRTYQEAKRKVCILTDPAKTEDTLTTVQSACSAIPLSANGPQTCPQESAIRSETGPGMAQRFLFVCLLFWFVFVSGFPFSSRSILSPGQRQHMSARESCVRVHVANPCSGRLSRACSSCSHLSGKKHGSRSMVNLLEMDSDQRLSNNRKNS